MKPAIYVRVSTDKQSYEQQIEPCINFAKYKGFNEYTVYKEIESSGKERKIFREMIKKVRDGVHNAIIDDKIDRDWRNTREFVMDFDNLTNQGINIFSVTEGLDPTTIMGKGMLHMIVVFAEIEKESISKNTKDRLQALKNMGKQLGRPKGKRDSNPRKKSGYYGNKNRSKKGGVKKHEK